MHSLPSSGRNWWGKSLYKAGRVPIALSQQIYPPILINPPGRERAFMAGAELQELLQMVENLNIGEGLEKLNEANKLAAKMALANTLANQFSDLSVQIENAHAHDNPSPTRDGIMHLLRNIILLLRHVGKGDMQVNEEGNQQDEAFREARRALARCLRQKFVVLRVDIEVTYPLTAARTGRMDLLDALFDLLTKTFNLELSMPSSIC